MGRNKRRRRQLPAKAPSAPSTGGWADLPDALLLSILDRRPSFRDLFSVAAVCRSWRAVSLCSRAGGRPPLFLRPIIGPVDVRFHSRRWIPPRRCDLLCPADPLAISRSMVSARTIGLSLLGSFYGHLIFCDGLRAILADPLTGAELRTPDLPSMNRRFYHGTLTGPLSYPGSYLILSADAKILRWRVGDSKWDTYPLTSFDVQVHHMVAHKDQIFALDNIERLHVLQFSPYFSIKQLAVQWVVESINLAVGFGLALHLVECGGELMLVRLVPTGQMMYAKFEVYRLDLSGQPAWEKVDSLGDWALFIDHAGRCPTSCASPGRWGGRSNCIYYAGSGCDMWYIFPLDDEAIDTTDPESPLYFDNQYFGKWPSPVWVYPSMLYRSLA